MSFCNPIRRGVRGISNLREFGTLIYLNEPFDHNFLLFYSRLYQNKMVYNCTWMSSRHSNILIWGWRAVSKRLEMPKRRFFEFIKIHFQVMRIFQIWGSFGGKINVIIKLDWAIFQALQPVPWLYFFKNILGQS